jgi:hypothetical protein
MIVYLFLKDGGRLEPEYIGLFVVFAWLVLGACHPWLEIRLLTPRLAGGLFVKARLASFEIR